MQDPIYVEEPTDSAAAVERVGSRVSAREPYIQVHYGEELSPVDRADIDARLRWKAGAQYNFIELDERTRSLELQSRRIQSIWARLVKA